MDENNKAEPLSLFHKQSQQFNVSEGQQPVSIIIHKANKLEPYNETIIELRRQATTQIFPRPLLTDTDDFIKLSVF